MGSVIAAHYVNDQWGYSFVVPGVLLIALACLVFVALPTNNNNSSQPTTLVPQQLQQQQLQQQHQQLQQQQHQSSSNSVSIKTSNSSSSLSSSSEAISFIRALQIPGIIHYSFALFFAKFVSYRFEKLNEKLVSLPRI